MDIVRGLDNLPGAQTRCVVADGGFDGVHLGHQNLLQRVSRLAQRLQAPACVVTYEPLPSEYFSGRAEGERLTLLEEKLDFFRATGLDLCVILRFDRVLSGWDCRRFVCRVFQEGLGAVAVVAGAGHTLGASGRGTLAVLRRLGAQMGFAVESVPDAMHEEERVSSTSIRNALRQGDVVRAAAMLGRPYSVCGTVRTGRGIGEGLGYPTANLLPDEKKLLPTDGVYAGHARAGALCYPAVAHVGANATFGERQRLVEVHVLDRRIELVGRNVCFEMVERIRATIRFPSVEQLKTQIRADVARAREILLRRSAGGRRG